MKKSRCCIHRNTKPGTFDVINPRYYNWTCYGPAKMIRYEWNHFKYLFPVIRTDWVGIDGGISFENRVQINYQTVQMHVGTE